MKTNKTWRWILFVFSAFFFILGTYNLVLMLVVSPAFHLYLLYKVIAGYFLAAVLYYIGAQKRKKARFDQEKS